MTRTVINHVDGGETIISANRDGGLTVRGPYSADIEYGPGYTVGDVVGQIRDAGWGGGIGGISGGSGGMGGGRRPLPGDSIHIPQEQK